MTKRTVHALSYWMKTTKFLLTFGLFKVKFDGADDFRMLMEAIAINKKLRKIMISYIVFDMEIFGKALGNTILIS